MCAQRRLRSAWASNQSDQSLRCALNVKLNQPGHPPSLMRVFAIHMTIAWTLRYPLSSHRRLLSDWDAQAIIFVIISRRQAFTFQVKSRLLRSQFSVEVRKNIILSSAEFTPSGITIKRSPFMTRAKQGLWRLNRWLKALFRLSTSDCASMHSG